ncbi:MAG: type IX secretion system sortase PorU, partial [Bacteroidales bacterium]|nr:type IX secretion system sortase PorU [Bacteroidales bacterium]
MKTKNIAQLYISFFKRCIMLLVMCIWVGLSTTESSALPVEHYASHSVLSTGKWYKISVTESGIHQISYSQLRSWGFSDPTQVRIYGFGGNVLPDVYSESDIDDLPQIPVVHDNDRILFYAQGTIKWKFDTRTNAPYHLQNTYATAGYYFITESSEEATSTTEAPLNTTADGEIIDLFDGYSLHEEEMVSVSKTGQVFLGEDFRFTQTRTISFDIPGIDTQSPMRVVVAFGAKILNSTGSLRLYHNGTLLSQDEQWNIATNRDMTYEFMKYITPSTTTTARGGKEDFSLTYKTGGTTICANLDYIRLSYKRKLQLYNGAVQFRAYDFTPGNSFAISGMNEECIVWDITEAHAPKHVATSIDNGVATFSPTMMQREYIAFNPSATFPTPTGVGSIANQDLHALETPDMVILAPAQFITQAQQVAALHESIDSMVVHVVNHELMFNEFSSGTPDAVAYRRFLKMFYDRSLANPNERQIKHLLLFGRGFYDNRRITNEIKKCNYQTLLTYQNARSENETYSYTCDDFFTYLEDATTSHNSANMMNIAVGRFPVKSTEEADIVVEKLYNYVNKPNYGNWRNQAIVIADDGNSNTHIRQAESAISYWLDDKADLFVNKVYLDAYNEENTSTGRTFPEAKKQMMRLLKEGQLVLDYIGHANSVGWTAEDLLNINDIKTLYLKNLPFMFTATCDFSRFDSEETSGGEYFFLNEQGGAIALFSSTRVAWINENGRLNNAIGEYLFERNEDNQYNRLGEIVQKGKNYITNLHREAPSRYTPDSNKLVYALLGDPAMRLGYPTYQVKASYINNIAIGNDITLDASTKVALEGYILTPDGKEAHDFNGEVYITLYDAEKITISNGYDDCPKMEFTERNNKLFMGRTKVENGLFKMTFNMPKVSSYSDKEGRLDFYAYNLEGDEACGICTDFKIGKTVNVTNTDTIGPDITYCYLNTADFSDGDIVNESPMLIAAISDSSGI